MPVDGAVGDGIGGGGLVAAGDKVGLGANVLGSEVVSGTGEGTRDAPGTKVPVPGLDVDTVAVDGTELDGTLVEGATVAPGASVLVLGSSVGIGVSRAVDGSSVVPVLGSAVENSVDCGTRLGARDSPGTREIAPVLGSDVGIAVSGRVVRAVPPGDRVPVFGSAVGSGVGIGVTIAVDGASVDGGALVRGTRVAPGTNVPVLGPAAGIGVIPGSVTTGANVAPGERVPVFGSADGSGVPSVVGPPGAALDTGAIVVGRVPYPNTFRSSQSAFTYEERGERTAATSRAAWCRFTINNGAAGFTLKVTDIDTRTDP